MGPLAGTFTHVILAIDIGSSSVRAVAYDTRGEAVPGVAARRPHRATTSGGGRVEADPERLFSLVVECLEEALLKATMARAPAFQGVALCTFWHGLLGADAEGRALTPVLTWADTRSAAQASRLGETVDAEALRQRTGCQLHPSYYPSKLAWFRENEPATFSAAQWWGSLGEHIQGRLLGQRRCSTSMASGSGLLDRDTLQWDPRVLEAIDLAPDHLSRLCDAGEPVGSLAEPWASRWPRLRGVPWFPALGDGACSNLGAGCGLPGRLVAMVGTTGAMRIVRQRAAVPVPRGLWSYLLDRRRMLLGGVLGDGGNLVEWMRGAMSFNRAPRETEEALFAARPAGHGLTVLPFLTGERSVGWNAAARGTVSGIRTDTSGLDMLQAGLEAVAYRFAAIRDQLRDAAAVDGEVVATGGALLASPAWCQILADALDAPVACSSIEEASSRGAALCALEALGCMSTDGMTPPVGRRFTPRAGAADAHRRAREEQEKLYRALYPAP